MENVKPSTWMLMGGGALLLISTFLEWISIGPFGASAWETDAFGLLGIFCAIIGVVVAGGIAAQTFGNVSLPDSMMGFSKKQIHVVLSEFALLITVGLLVRGDVGIGLFLALIASAVMFAGAFMELKDNSAPAAPPGSF